jgi:hypothetical protein
VFYEVYARPTANTLRTGHPLVIPDVVDDGPGLTLRLYIRAQLHRPYKPPIETEFQVDPL